MLTNEIERDAMPIELRHLLLVHPRVGWPQHPNFKRATENWLGAHKMFRKLAELIRSGTEQFLGDEITADELAAQLGYYGDAMVRNLHGHHSWEDAVYFPELAAADSRFTKGLAILERDHEVLDHVLADFSDSANLAMRGRREASDLKQLVGVVHAHARTIESLLKRHLEDEEDLAVPIILHHKLRG